MDFTITRIPKIISIEGNIGAGKTTFVQELKKRLRPDLSAFAQEITVKLCSYRLEISASSKSFKKRKKHPAIHSPEVSTRANCTFLLLCLCPHILFTLCL